MIEGFIIGPGKSGTTLMISLLDDHPELCVIPFEVKFYRHYFETLRKTDSYDELNRYFLNRSKLRLIDTKRSGEIDIFNSGHVDFSDVRFEKLVGAMHERSRQYRMKRPDGSVLARYINDLHEAFEFTKGSCAGKKGFVIKEGNHGLPYIDKIMKDFPNAKFIVMARDPRDMFSSYKTISDADQPARSSFSRDNGVLRYIFRIYKINTLCREFMKYFQDIQENARFIYIRYEDLVNDPKKEMLRVCKFLGIGYNDAVIRPTTAGNTWGGNSSDKSRFNMVKNSRVGKWHKQLTKEEVLLIEYFLGGYMKKFKYERLYDPISKVDCIKAVRLAHFGRPYPSRDGFLGKVLGVMKYLRNSLIYCFNLIRG